VKVYIFILLVSALISGCASNSIDLTISDKFSVTNLSEITKITKFGDFIAITGKNRKTLAITENDFLDLSKDIDLSSQEFFNHIFNEDEDKSTSNGKIVNEFRIGLLLDGYTSKDSISSNGVTIYIWNQVHNKFVAIAADHESNFYLNIIGENVDPNKIRNIVKNKEVAR